MAVYAKNQEPTVIPSLEDKMKLLVALRRALNSDANAHAKTPTLVKAVGVKNVNA